jgi:hypothetical protein
LIELSDSDPEVAIDAEIHDLYDLTDQLTTQIADQVKLCHTGECQKLRKRRTDVWRRIEELEASLSPVEEPKIEFPRPKDIDPTDEVRRRFFKDVELSPDDRNLIHAICNDRQPFVFVNWPAKESQFLRDLLIGGLSRAGPLLLLAGDSVRLQKQMDQSVPKDRVLINCSDRDPSLICFFDVHCLSKQSFYYNETFSAKVMAIDRQFPGVQKVAFSHIASPSIERDLSLFFQVDFFSFRHSLFLGDLFLEVTQKENTQQLLNWIVGHGLQQKLGTIFCSSARECEQVSFFLNENGLSSAFYHKLMTAEQTQMVLANWEKRSISAIVAVSGHEPPLPCLDYCVHFCLPPNLEVFAYHCCHVAKCCVVMSNRLDEMLMKRSIQDRPRFSEVLSFVNEAKECRHHLIARAFGEPDEMKCEGKCDVCLTESRRLLQEIDFQHLIKSMKSVPTESHILSLLAGEDRHASDSKLPYFGCCAETHPAIIRQALKILVERNKLLVTGKQGQHGETRYFELAQ